MKLRFFTFLALFFSSFSVFSTSCDVDANAYYLENNPDVAAAGISAIWHWGNYGIQEGRASCWNPDMTCKSTGLPYSGTGACISSVPAIDCPYPKINDPANNQQCIYPSPSTVTNPDGSTTTTEYQSDGTQIKTTAKSDGSTLINKTFTDGMKIDTTLNADGTKNVITTYSDGSKVASIVKADGSVSTIRSSADGSDATLQTNTANPDGSVTSKLTLSDGTVINKTIASDGSVSYNNLQGSNKTINADGSTTETITLGDGHTITKVKHADGSTSYSNLTGSYSTSIGSDGTITKSALLSDGSTFSFVTNPDGYSFLSGKVSQISGDIPVIHTSRSDCVASGGSCSQFGCSLHDKIVQMSCFAPVKFSPTGGVSIAGCPDGQTMMANGHCSGSTIPSTGGATDTSGRVSCFSGFSVVDGVCKANTSSGSLTAASVSAASGTLSGSASGSPADMTATNSKLDTLHNDLNHQATSTVSGSGVVSNSEFNSGVDATTTSHYEKTNKTFSGVLTTFTGQISSSPLISSASNFFQVVASNSSCPVWSVSAWVFTLVIDQQCSDIMTNTVFPIISAVLTLVFSFHAFRVAFL